LPEADKAKFYKALDSLGIKGINVVADAKLSFIKLLQGDPNVPDVTTAQILKAIKDAGYPVD
jgi:hypothetical protein